MCCSSYAFSCFSKPVSNIMISQNSALRFRFDLLFHFVSSCSINMSLCVFLKIILMVQHILRCIKTLWVSRLCQVFTLMLDVKLVSAALLLHFCSGTLTQHAALIRDPSCPVEQGVKTCLTRCLLELLSAHASCNYPYYFTGQSDSGGQAPKVTPSPRRRSKSSEQSHDSGQPLSFPAALRQNPLHVTVASDAQIHFFLA